MKNKVFYDFIEIGTANFNTIIEDCPEDSVGLSIEPVEEYLNQLPEKKNVTKVCCAVRGGGPEEELKLYFIPEEEIDRIGLPVWLKGCNSVGFMHEQLNTYASIVKSRKINIISIAALFHRYNVSGCEAIKIDSEGYDFDILQGIRAHIEDNPEFIKPEWIQFEGRVILTDDCNSIISSFTEIGYELEYVNHDNYIVNGNDYLLTLNEDE